MNINPRGLLVREWCDYMVDELIGFGQAPFLQDETEWQRWGQEICKLPGIAGYNPPDPMFFNNFYDWAERFNSAVLL
jgi:hypothetical protein